MSDIPPLYCANHPNVETGLRCNNCGKPICPKCAVLTPTGYRCKECVRNQQKVFDTAAWYDPLIAFLIAGVLSFLGSLLANILGFFVLFVAPIAGVIIAEAIRFAVQRRRSTRLFQAAAAGAALGSLPLLTMAVFRIAAFGLGSILGLVWLGYYAFTVTTTVFYRLRGIRIR
jgi:hypothetical protein